jgi:RNA polymerase sigma-70 factor (ECF subfamily)
VGELEVGAVTCHTAALLRLVVTMSAMTVAISDEELEAVRRRGFGVAYRMLGSVSEAEDVAQEAMLRMAKSHEEIEEPAAWITTAATRLSIDVLRSARKRRESYVGPWLPEPLVQDSAPGPESQAELADSLSQAFLVMLERLTPVERAAFLLREVFDYDYSRIAEILDRSEVSSRQLVTRAKKHIESSRPRFDPDEELRERLLERFLAAARDGDVEGLEALLAEDVELHGDGGGKAPALARALFGRARVARTLRNWMRVGDRIGGVTWRRVDVNGQPGAIFLDPEGRVLSVMALEIADGQVQGIRSIVNPDKLQHLGPVADAAALLRGDPS